MNWARPPTPTRASPSGSVSRRGSGLVAFAAALGFMPLDMPESVLVRFRGRPAPDLTLRDAVNAIPYFAIKAGLLTVAKKNKKNVFNGRLIEIEGLEDLSADEAYQFTDSSAERSAAGAVIALGEERVAKYPEKQRRPDEADDRRRVSRRSSPRRAHPGV